MKDQNLSFGSYIRRKRLESPDELTLKDVSEKLGISLSMFSDIEQNRRVPSESFDYETLANLYDLDSREKALMYDLAARRKRTVPPDIEDTLMYSETGDLARLALRMTNEGTANEEDWKRFIWQLEKKRSVKK